MKLKPILFIDNDNTDRAKQDLAGVAGDILEDSYGLPHGSYTVELMADFGQKEGYEVTQILFGGHRVLASMSAYTRSPLGTDSLMQGASLLAKAGRNDVEGIVFLDLDSGGVTSHLHTMLDRIKPEQILPLLRAVETNHIIGWGRDGIHRVRIDHTAWDLVRKEPITPGELHKLMQEEAAVC
jgi:hypothetical protein